MYTFIEKNIFFPETCFAYPISEQKFMVCPGIKFQLRIIFFVILKFLHKLKGKKRQATMPATPRQSCFAVVVVVQGLQTLSVKSNFDVRRRKIGEIFNVKVFS